METTGTHHPVEYNAITSRSMTTRYSVMMLYVLNQKGIHRTLSKEQSDCWQSGCCETDCYSSRPNPPDDNYHVQ